MPQLSSWPQTAFSYTEPGQEIALSYSIMHQRYVGKEKSNGTFQHGNGQLHREVLLRFAEQKCNATSVRIRLADTN